MYAIIQITFHLSASSSLPMNLTIPPQRYFASAGKRLQWLFGFFKYFLKSSDNEDNNKVKGSDKSLDIIKNTIKDSMDSTVSLLNSDDMFQIARLSENRPIYLHSPAGLTDIAVNYLESMLFIRLPENIQNHCCQGRTPLYTDRG